MDTTPKLAGKVAVVTGGGRGIGRTICLALAGAGADVAVTSTTQERNLRVAGEVEALGRRSCAYAADVADQDSVSSMAGAVLDEMGRCDILVCNAGIQRFSAFLSSDFDKWRRVVEVHLYGAYHCCKSFLPGMVERDWGRVVIISSIMGKMPSPFYSSYSVAKHALIGLTRVLAAETAVLGAKGVTVNAVCPGFTDTDMVTGPEGTLTRTAEKMGSSPDEAWERYFRVGLQDRLLEPEEIAAMVAYLASDDARGITGQAINVCGGSVFY
jgi:NAD(P)-dependent dehydrogenase (short-subunit alcohol dehydrogenase family)